MSRAKAGSLAGKMVAALRAEGRAMAAADIAAVIGTHPNYITRLARQARVREEVERVDFGRFTRYRLKPANAARPPRAPAPRVEARAVRRGPRRGREEIEIRARRGADGTEGWEWELRDDGTVVAHCWHLRRKDAQACAKAYRDRRRATLRSVDAAMLRGSGAVNAGR